MLKSSLLHDGVGLVSSPFSGAHLILGLRTLDRNFSSYLPINYQLCRENNFQIWLLKWSQHIHAENTLNVENNKGGEKPLWRTGTSLPLVAESIALAALSVAVLTITGQTGWISALVGRRMISGRG